MKEPVRRSPQIERYILEELTKGRTLLAICRDPGMPSDMAVRKWVNEDTIFGSKYARARDTGLEALSEELFEIADDGKNDTYVDKRGKTKVDNEAVQRSKLRVDTRRWYLSKIAPKRYGDRITVDNNVTITLARALELLEEDSPRELPSPG